MENRKIIWAMCEAMDNVGEPKPIGDNYNNFIIYQYPEDKTNNLDFKGVFSLLRSDTDEDLEPFGDTYNTDMECDNNFITSYDLSFYWHSNSDLMTLGNKIMEEIADDMKCYIKEE